MKKLTLFATLALATLLFTSCGKNSYKQFVGTWGVEKIEYYNIDFYGNPIAGSIETYTYDPNDTNNGIHLIFRENKTGEMRDSAIDTLGINWNSETQSYDSLIYCPDTVLVYPFSYSYDKTDNSLFMSMDYGTYIRTFRMNVEDITSNSFIYENEYDKNYMERAYLKRISSDILKSGSRQATKHPLKRGSLLGDR